MRPLTFRRAGMGRPIGRHRSGLGGIGGEEPPHHGVGPLAHLRHLRMTIHVGEQKRLDFAVRGGDRRRKADQRSAGLLHVFEACRAGGGDARAAFGDDVLDEAGNDPARQLVDGARPFQTGMQALDLVEQLGDERYGADGGEIEQAGAQAVVDVVRVIGDVVGDRRRLRLQTGVLGEMQALPAIVGEDRGRDAARAPAFERPPAGVDQRTIVLDQPFERLLGQIEAVEIGIRRSSSVTRRRPWPLWSKPP